MLVTDSMDKTEIGLAEYEICPASPAEQSKPDAQQPSKTHGAVKLKYQSSSTSSPMQTENDEDDQWLFTYRVQSRETNEQGTRNRQQMENVR